MRRKPRLVDKHGGINVANRNITELMSDLDILYAYLIDNSASADLIDGVAKLISMERR